MLVAAAVCPCPPLLVPAVSAGAAPEFDAARAACVTAVRALAEARPERLVVVGPAERSGRGAHPAGTPGSFRAFGVDLAVRLGTPAEGEDAEEGDGERELPPSLAVAAWLLEYAGFPPLPVSGLGVGEPLAPERCLTAGAGLAAGGDRLALLVMGDGSACRSVKAPGYLDERAAGFDAAAARALGAADTEALAAMDPELAYELRAAGRAPWQVLAGAARNAGLTGRLLLDEAPYGVGYFVATWT
ncbi:class III extradiol dioxygenase subunit B-like domain-containing protein [Streptomyces sp. NPDC058045]|uniref:class III extradiol dioxygenase subunit B-like domain-containing protein n=1 Tax=Streptomyces sp. NPDC058045 TaxID=3346311 RepID=UPI0036E1BE8E